MMKQGFIFSLLLHILVLILLVFGLPFSFKRTPEPWAPIPIEMVEIADETMAPKPTLKPIEEKKPEDLKPAPKPEPKPEPEKAPEPEPKPAEPEPKPEPEPLPAPEPEPVKEAVPLPEPKPEKKEEPKPEKVELPKEKPKTEKPPQPKKKPEVKKPKEKPKKKEDSASFDSVLKNLEKIKKNMDSEETDEDADEEEGSSRKDVGKVGDKVTMSELDAVRRQLAQCWNIPAGAKDARELIVEVKIWLNQDGTVREAKVIQNLTYKGHPFYQIASESALRAVKDPRCSPLKLPPHKYEQWKIMTLTFDPKKML